MGENQKNPRAHKNKIGTPAPPPPPPKTRNLWTWVFSCRKNAIFPGVHKIGAPISGPRIADTNFTDTRLFLRENARLKIRHACVATRVSKMLVFRGLLQALVDSVSVRLVAPYRAIPRDYLSDTPLLRAMGFLVSQHGQLGAIPPPPFLSVSPLESMRSGGAIHPHKRGISAIPARYPMKTRQMGAIPPSAILSRKGLARFGGVSRTGPLSRCV